MGTPEMDYARFLARKAQLESDGGFEPLWLPDAMYDFQRSLTEVAIRKGRSASFEDCGLGKTFQELVWAENVVRKTGKPVLILTPLAVSAQTVREGEKFGIEVKRADPGGGLRAGIHVTNYERLHHFDSADFAGVVCDESSILKNFDGATKEAVTSFMRKMPYRLLCTATAAPNDYIEPCFSGWVPNAGIAASRRRRWPSGPPSLAPDGAAVTDGNAPGLVLTRRALAGHVVAAGRPAGVGWRAWPINTTNLAHSCPTSPLASSALQGPWSLLRGGGF